MKRRNPAVGALVTVPLSDGRFAIGQIVGREPQVLNSGTCAFFRSRIGKEEAVEPRDVLLPEDVASVQFVTGDRLKQGRWKIHAPVAVRLPKGDFPPRGVSGEWTDRREDDRSGIIESFLPAFHGLGYWNEVKKPEYHEHLLLPRISRPPGIKRKTA